MTWTPDAILEWEAALDEETMDELIKAHGDGPNEWILEELDKVLNEGAYLDRAEQPNFVRVALVVGQRLGYAREDYRVLDCLFQYAVATWHRFYADEWAQKGLLAGA